MVRACFPCSTTASSRLGSKHHGAERANSVSSRIHEVFMLNLRGRIISNILTIYTHFKNQNQCREDGIPMIFLKYPRIMTTSMHHLFKAFKRPDSEEHYFLEHHIRCHQSRLKHFEKSFSWGYCFAPSSVDRQLHTGMADYTFLFGCWAGHVFLANLAFFSYPQP